MKQETIQICFIQHFPSVKEGIFALTGISRSQLKKYPFKKKFLEREVRPQDSLELPINLVNHLKINPNYEGGKVSVIFEDNRLIAFSKPTKVHSHPLSYRENDNLLSAMINLGYSKYLGVNHLNYDRGLLYRLDYETSGLMIYIKEDQLYTDLREQFQTVVKEKIYLAVVEGDCKFLKLNTYLAPSGGKGHIMVEHPEGVLNEIKLTKLAYDEKNNQTLLKVYLGHGHRHQIRAQLAYSGHPIVGDELYGKAKHSELMLHCFEYVLTIEDQLYALKDESYQRLMGNFASFNHKL